jgi:uncharacterized protein (DUF58 family)
MTLALASAALTGVGCTRPAQSSERFLPDSAAAQAALEAALAAWQSGDPIGAVTVGSATVQVVDSHRKPEQQLKQFEVLGEVGGDSGRCFAVQLVLDSPPETVKARFVVIGIEPLWVFREEDLTMLSHWEHPMDDPKPAQPTDK